MPRSSSSRCDTCKLLNRLDNHMCCLDLDLQFAKMERRSPIRSTRLHVTITAPVQTHVAPRNRPMNYNPDELARLGF